MIIIFVLLSLLGIISIFFEKTGIFIQRKKNDLSNVELAEVELKVI
jgi:hypothetical protein